MDHYTYKIGQYKNTAENDHIRPAGYGSPRLIITDIDVYLRPIWVRPEIYCYTRGY